MGRRKPYAEIKRISAARIVLVITLVRRICAYFSEAAAPSIEFVKVPEVGVNVTSDGIVIGVSIFSAAVDPDIKGLLLSRRYRRFRRHCLFHHLCHCFCRLCHHPCCPCHRLCHRLCRPYRRRLRHHCRRRHL